MTADTDKIENAAEEARARDAAALAGQVTNLVTPEDDYLLDIPLWLRRSLTPEQREDAWVKHCTAHDIVVDTRVRARDEESHAKFLEPEAHPDLRAISQAEKDRIRIAKMKAGIAQKKAVASGETKQMPLSGKDALAKIKGDEP